MANYNGPSGPAEYVASLSNQIFELNLKAKECRQQATDLDGFAKDLGAKLTVAKDLQAAESWPLWHFYKDRVLDLLKKDSDWVAASKIAGQTGRPYVYTLKSAYDKVKADDEAEQKRKQEALLRRYNLHTGTWKLVYPSATYHRAYTAKTIPEKTSEWTYTTHSWRQAPPVKPSRYFPGARVSYRPNPKKAALWTGTVIVRPTSDLCFPQYSLVTRGELTYVIKDGTINIRGCFARNLEPAK